MKKLLSLILCAVMILSMLAGCGSKETPPATEAPKDAVSTEAPAPAQSETAEKTKVRMAYWNSEDTVAALLDYLAEAVPDVEI